MIITPAKTDNSPQDVASRRASTAVVDVESKRKIEPEESQQRSIIVVGSKGVGKTTMIYRFLEKGESKKPTIAMDYSFGRMANKSLVKDVLHVWEVGSLSSSLISVALTGSGLTHSPHNVTFIIMLDLAKPECLMSTLEDCLTAVKSAVKMSYDAKTLGELKEARSRKLNKCKEPEGTLDVFPFMLIFVGGMYDKFKDFDFPKKELIGRSLRVIAHHLGAGLQYHSSKDSSLFRRTKDLLSHYGFGSETLKGSVIDYEKPLLLSPGSDSLALINFNLPQGRATAILDTIKQSYLAEIPEGSREDEATLEDPANDPNFNEPIIDKLRTQREEEICSLLSDLLEGRDEKIAIPEPI